MNCFGSTGMTTGMRPNFKIPPKVATQAALIKVLLMDVDGVMTDGRHFYVSGSDGQPFETKCFYSQDGLGLHMWHAAGFISGLISGRRSPAVAEYARVMRIRYVFQGNLDKKGVYEEILADAGVAPEQVAFVGDDFIDVSLMRRSGLGVAVANGRPEVIAAADIVTTASGGAGAVREIIELILQAQGLFADVIKKYELG